MFKRKLAAAVVGTAALVGGTVATAAPANAATVIGIFYWNSNYGGSTYTVTAGGTTSCTGTTGDWDFTSGFSSSWNDEASSHKGFANCAIKVYENAGQGGASSGFYVNLSGYGVLNDEVTSALYS
ncbi:hypothetical protein OHA37_12250 [Streptomyces sp. NBC_00335]|uniref:hypothetical protein n=1 Tax=unclassified Streptomyces TaxID=2593676 RepID=UPI002256C0B6|nr:MULTISPECIES: hypothetical protein [unclassified Streptomyces]MCX5404652.1 hypothetical protein [Streptomyces sp. NBC_00086]